MPDIEHELQLTPQQVNGPGESPETTEASWGARAPAAATRTISPVLAVCLGLLIATILGVTGTGIWMFIGREPPPPTAKPGTGEGSDGTLADLPAEQLKAAIETTVRGYLGASNELARSQWVVGGQSTVNTLREFHSRSEVKPPRSFGRINNVESTEIDGFPMHMVVAAEEDGITGHLLSVIPIGDRLLVDWESSVGYGELSWGRFLSTKPAKPVKMRIYLERDTHFSNAFTDKSRWDSYQVSARGYPDSLHAYVAKGGVLGKQIRQLVPPGASQPVNVRLHWADEGRALIVTEVIHNYWVDLNRLRKLTRR